VFNFDLEKHSLEQVVWVQWNKCCLSSLKQWVVIGGVRIYLIVPHRRILQQRTKLASITEKSFGSTKYSFLVNLQLIMFIYGFKFFTAWLIKALEQN